MMGSVDSEQAVATGKTVGWIARYGQILTFLFAQATAAVACGCLFLMLRVNDQLAAHTTPAETALMLAGGCLTLVIAVVYRVLAVPARKRRAMEAYDASGDQPVLPIHTDRPLSGPLEALLIASTAATHKSQVFFVTSACINLTLMYLDESWIHLSLAFVSILVVIWQTPTVGRLAKIIQQALGRERFTRQTS